MKEKFVLDTGVLHLHFADRENVRKYFNSIIADRSIGLIAEVSLSEFYYKICQKLGKQTADTWYFQLRRTNIILVHNQELVRLAGLEKCEQPHRLALADCFALALAKMEHATLLTTDSELARVRDVDVRLFEL